MQETGISQSITIEPDPVRIEVDPVLLKNAFLHFKEHCAIPLVSRDVFFDRLEKLLKEEKVIAAVAFWAGILSEGEPRANNLLGRCAASGNLSAQYLASYFLGQQGERARSQLTDLVVGFKGSKEPESLRNVFRWAITEIAPPPSFLNMSISVSALTTSVTSDAGSAFSVVTGGSPAPEYVREAFVGVVLAVITDGTGMFAGPFQNELDILDSAWNEGGTKLKRSLFPAGGVVEQIQHLTRCLESNKPETRIAAAHALSSLGEAVQTFIPPIREAFMKAHASADVYFEAALIEALAAGGRILSHDRELISSAHHAHSEVGRAHAASLIGDMGGAGAQYLPYLYEDFNATDQPVLCGTALTAVRQVLKERPEYADEIAVKLIESSALNYPHSIVQIRAFSTLQLALDAEVPLPETVIEAGLKALRTGDDLLKIAAGDLLVDAEEQAELLIPEFVRVLEESDNEELTVYTLVNLACLVAATDHDFTEIPVVKRFIIDPDLSEAISGALEYAMKIIEGDEEEE